MLDRVRRLATALVALVACDPAPAPEQPPAPSPEAIRVAESVFDTAPGMLEFLDLDELAPRHRGKRVKVHGFVADAPIERTKDGARHRFVIEHGAATLVVEYEGLLPDRFQPRLEVILTGKLSDDGTRIATDDLVAKCPESYDDGTKPPH